MKIVLRNLELLLKWNKENNGSEIERKMLEECVREVKEKIADDLDEELNKHLQGS